MMMLVYKIKNPLGLYSSGGMCPSFNKTGKTWSSRGHVSSHLAQFADKEKHVYYTNCVVVAIEIKEEECEEINVSEWKNSDKTERAKELKKQKQLIQNKERNQKEIERLTKELENLKSL
jgi:hypothetical protein